MQLDIRTILFSQSLLGLLATAVMLLLWRGVRSHASGVGWWTASYAAITAGQTLIMLRGTIPYVLTMVPANLLIVGGMAALYYGVRAFLGKAAHPAYGIALLAVISFSATVFGHLRPSVPPRLVVLSVIPIVNSSLCAASLLRHAGKEISANARAVAAVHGAFVVLYLIRLYGVFRYEPGPDWLLSSSWEAASYLGITVVHAALAYTMIELVDAKIRERIVLNAEEKTLLLREMHHRTKNDFALAESIIALESGSVRDQEAAAALDRIRGRIRSFAILHDRLYRGKATGTVDAGEYVALIAAGLVEGGAEEGRIALETDTAEIEVEARTAVALGLLANELITNALKHAFPNGRKGAIRVSLGKTPEGGMLAVEDDGVGMATDRPGKAEPRLGTVLIDTLASQLSGQVERTAGSGGAGTRVSISVPLAG